MGGLNCNCATFCLRTHPLWNILKNSFFKKVLYLVVEYILNFSPESEKFYFLENMLMYLDFTDGTSFIPFYNGLRSDGNGLFWY